MPGDRACTADPGRCNRLPRQDPAPEVGAQNHEHEPHLQSLRRDLSKWTYDNTAPLQNSLRHSGSPPIGAELHSPHACAAGRCSHKHQPRCKAPDGRHTPAAQPSARPARASTCARRARRSRRAPAPAGTARRRPAAPLRRGRRQKTQIPAASHGHQGTAASRALRPRSRQPRRRRARGMRRRCLLAQTQTRLWPRGSAAARSR